MDGNVQYTRPNGFVYSLAGTAQPKTIPGILQFGGEKPTLGSPPNMLCEYHPDPHAFDLI